MFEVKIDYELRYFLTSTALNVAGSWSRTCSIQLNITSWEECIERTKWKRGSQTRAIGMKTVAKRAVIVKVVCTRREATNSSSEPSTSRFFRGHVVVTRNAMCIGLNVEMELVPPFTTNPQATASSSCHIRLGKTLP